MKLLKVICFSASVFLFSSYAFAHEADITITGSDAPVNGSCYTADGGHEPYAWTITKGAIDSNGCVSGILNQCGAATVTVTDSCGETAVKSVRMPNGKWVEILHCHSYVYYYYFPAGDTRWTRDIYYAYGEAGCILNDHAGDIQRDCSTELSLPVPSCGSNTFPFIRWGYKYEWRCQ